MFGYRLLPPPPLTVGGSATAGYTCTRGPRGGRRAGRRAGGWAGLELCGPACAAAPLWSRDWAPWREGPEGRHCPRPRSLGASARGAAAPSRRGTGGTRARRTEHLKLSRGCRVRGWQGNSY